MPVNKQFIEKETKVNITLLEPIMHLSEYMTYVSKF